MSTEPLVSEFVSKMLDLPREKRREYVRSLPRQTRVALLFSRELWLRPKQMWRPTHHEYWIAMAGRGFGKTLMGAYTVQHVAQNPELCGGRKSEGELDTRNGEGGVIAIAGRVANDVNQTMVHGISGIMAVSPPWFRPVHNKSEKTLTWPNGVVGRLMSADVPDSFRGINSGFVWADEMPHWRRLRETWDNLELGRRIGVHPRGLITTTPLGVQPLIELVYKCDEAGHPIPNQDSPGGYEPNPDSFVIRGTTRDNLANLATSFIKKTIGKYDGRPIGRQEIEGQLIIGIDDALWRMDWFDRLDEPPCRLVKTIVGVDPAGSKKRHSAETGIVVVGLGEDGRMYVLADVSGKYTPKEWAQKAIDCYHRFNCSAIVAEQNMGVDMVESNIKLHSKHRIKVHAVTAHKSKGDRARMVNGNWELGLVSHCGDHHQWRNMEMEMVQFDPTKTEGKQKSDRLDACVWACLYLLGGGDDLSQLRVLGDKQLWGQVEKSLERRRAKEGGRSDDVERRRRQRRKKYGQELATVLELVPTEAVDALGEDAVVEMILAA